MSNEFNYEVPSSFGFTVTRREILGAIEIAQTFEGAEDRIILNEHEAEELIRGLQRALEWSRGTPMQTESYPPPCAVVSPDWTPPQNWPKPKKVKKP